MSAAPPEKPRAAVALHYDGEGAPRVTAKGRGAVAEQILALAREHDVPVREDGPLAELLGRVELGDEVPRELYLAVAQVIAFAYQLSGRAPPVPRPGVREVREGPEETGRGPPQGGSDPPE